jgi:hypothetical protein
MRIGFRYLTCAAVVAIATIVTARADVVWPALVLEPRLFGMWAIAAGLAAEYVWLIWPMHLTLSKALLVDLAMNAASSACGLVLVPLAGLVWEVFSGVLMYKVFDIGTFNPMTWAATFVLAVIVNSSIEALVIVKGFKIPLTRFRFRLLCAANAVSVGLAFVSFYYEPLIT